jgi:hypothetical protein
MVFLVSLPNWVQKCYENTLSLVFNLQVCRIIMIPTLKKAVGLDFQILLESVFTT